MKVSIIIPLVKINEYIKEAIKYYEKLNYNDFELIILPDFEEEYKFDTTLKDIKIIPSGKVGPAEKRDMGAKIATGEILAFIDDDAYPCSEWLNNAIKYFKENENIAAVGGPAITPDNDNFWQKVSGAVYSNIFMSGQYRRRYIPIKPAVIDYDIPSVNLIVRKKVFDEIGGFDSTYYPGEDTKLCLEIKKRNYYIIYDPEVLVYHHRRNLFPAHFKQIANYALHRGFFVKKYPETSLKISYFIPSLFLLGLIFGPILSLFIKGLIILYIYSIIFYFLCLFFSSLKINLIFTFWTVVGIFFSHIVYGFNFLKGLLFTKELKR